jgi:hypothetical protein
MQRKLFSAAEYMDKQVGYVALTIDGPFRENIGALIAHPVR